MPYDDPARALQPRAGSSGAFATIGSVRAKTQKATSVKYATTMYGDALRDARPPRKSDTPNVNALPNPKTTDSVAITLKEQQQ